MNKSRKTVYSVIILALSVLTAFLIHEGLTIGIKTKDFNNLYLSMAPLISTLIIFLLNGSGFISNKSVECLMSFSIITSIVFIGLDKRISNLLLYTGLLIALTRSVQRTKSLTRKIS